MTYREPSYETVGDVGVITLDSRLPGLRPPRPGARRHPWEVLR